MRSLFCLNALLLALCWGPGAAWAQQPAATTAAPDSAQLTGRPQRLTEVRVQAIRPERFAMGSRRLTLDSAVLAQYRGGNLADVLQARTPLALKNYGPGQLATIALRGTSAQHTAVLWNGLNIMLPTLGQNDFSLLSAGAASSVAVQPGPAAALYGSGAIGGAVLLNNDPDWRPGLRGSVQADAGSFGLRGGNMEVRTASPAVAVRLATSYREAQNDYSYVLQEARGPVRYRVRNAALRHQWSINSDLAWRLGTAGELTAGAWVTDTDREIQPGVFLPNTQAEERDQSRRFVLGYRHVAARQQWAVRAAWFEDVINYRDGGDWSNSRVQTSQAQAEHTQAVGARGSLRLGAELQRFAAWVDGYGNGRISENRAAAFALLRYDPRPALRLTANLRQALLPGRQAPLTPTAGLEWDLLHTGPDSVGAGSLHRLTLKASAARSYRAPTLNERYWQPGGNPNLRPEVGAGFEAGLQQHLTLKPNLTLETELTAFRQEVDNWVQWLPTPGAGYYSPRNLRQVRSQGLEASTALRLRQGRYMGTAQLAYHFTHTRKTQGVAADPEPTGVQLAFVPLHQASFSTDHHWRAWLASSTLALTSYRYINASGTDYLPGTALLGVTLGRTLRGPAGTSLLVLVQATNLLNQAYNSYPGRPAPPRALSASLRLNWP